VWLCIPDGPCDRQQTTLATAATTGHPPYLPPSPPSELVARRCWALGVGVGEDWGTGGKKSEGSETPTRVAVVTGARGQKGSSKKTAPPLLETTNNLNKYTQPHTTHNSRTAAQTAFKCKARAGGGRGNRGAWGYGRCHTTKAAPAATPFHRCWAGSRLRRLKRQGMHW